MTPLEDFIDNPEPYNAQCAGEFIQRFIESNKHFTGTKLQATVSYPNQTSLKELLQWCIAFPQPKELLQQAVDKMISGWVRAKFMDLIDPPPPDSH